MSTNTAVAHHGVRPGPELAGTIVRPGDERFDQARQAWNPSAAVDAFVQVSDATAAFPLLSAEIRHLGGELARPRSGHGQPPRPARGPLTASSTGDHHVG